MFTGAGNITQVIYMWTRTQTRNLAKLLHGLMHKKVSDIVL